MPAATAADQCALTLVGAHFVLFPHGNRPFIKYVQALSNSRGSFPIIRRSPIEKTLSVLLPAFPMYRRFLPAQLLHWLGNRHRPSKRRPLSKRLRPYGPGTPAENRLGKSPSFPADGGWALPISQRKRALPPDSGKRGGRPLPNLRPAPPFPQPVRAFAGIRAGPLL